MLKPNSSIQEVLALHQNTNNPIDPRHGPYPPDEAKQPAEPGSLNHSSLCVPVEFDLVIDCWQPGRMILGS